MYIIIVGGGRVGYYLARALLNEGHEILIVEQKARFCDIINEEMGSICVQGDGCEATTLNEVGTGRADMLVAVTGDDADNMVACQVAKHKFNVPRTIARVRNPQNEILFKKLGINVTVSATNIILEAIEKEVPTHTLTHLMTRDDRGLEIVEIRIPSGAKTIGKAVKGVSLPEGTKLALLIPRDRNPVIPNPNTVIYEGDQIIALTTPELEEELRSNLTGI
jgi:trk system potassium uptake protein TrkA